MSGDPAQRPFRVESFDGLTGRAWGSPPYAAVFLHGSLLSAAAWDQVLAPADFSALALDLPGHGDSVRFADGDYTHPRIAREIVRALGDALPATVVGHSRGGVVATHVAALARERVTCLVLVDADPTRPRPSATGRPLMRWSGSFDELVDDAAAMRPDLARDRVADGVRRGAREREDGSWAWRWDPAVATRPDETEVAENRAALAAVRAEVTVIRGELSGAIRPEARDRIEATLGRPIRLRDVRSGHNPHSEAPDALRGLLADALAGRA